ncbi:cytochrome P450 [Boletus edulis BED1]|uniref:Cytochrome P450 n=1 Tax=Boletus edulis BED1 TaxID=1328754 RepID=A0AAD4GM03_BOLED|nr:cytochrome P450 [Boletus edulis BED1]
MFTGCAASRRLGVRNNSTSLQLAWRCGKTAGLRRRTSRGMGMGKSPRLRFQRMNDEHPINVISGNWTSAYIEPSASMFPVRKLLFSAFASATVYSLWKVLRLVCYRPYRSSLRYLRGPKRTSWILGNLGEFLNDEDGTLFETWVKEYGDTLRFIGLFNNSQLFTLDKRAVHHILTHTDVYQKAPEARTALGRIFGEGLLVVEGMQHRQQRRIMNPAFGPTQIRALTDIFFVKANRLRDLWFSEISKDPTGTIADTRIDVVPWFTRVTLDIIGLTGFNYDFDALEASGQPNELSEAFSTLFSASQSITILDVLQALFPVLHHIPTVESRKLQAAQQTMTQIGKDLLMNAKATALASATENGNIEKDSLHGRDLLSLLVKANMATDIPESQKLSDKDVIAQVPTFLVAGHETTSSAVTWALYAMTQAPEVQTKLRDELLSAETDAPSMDELMALPYLDAVLRETLRVHPPVPNTSRLAMKDEVLPVEKPYTDRFGVVRDTIPITKGDPIIIPIREMNRSTELWGPDAHEFKPERWNNVPEAVSQVPGIWSHLLTFVGGPRACIGFRFSIVESKAILFSLVRAFEFELAVPASQIGSRTAIVQRPILRSDPTQPQLPLLVRPYQRTLG